MAQDDKPKPGSDRPLEKRIQQNENIERKSQVIRVSDTEQPPPRRRDGDTKS